MANIGDVVRVRFGVEFMSGFVTELDKDGPGTVTVEFTRPPTGHPAVVGATYMADHVEVIPATPVDEFGSILMTFLSNEARKALYATCSEGRSAIFVVKALRGLDAGVSLSQARVIALWVVANLIRTIGWDEIVSAYKAMNEEIE